MLCVAESYNPPLRLERSLEKFKILSPVDFSLPIYSIKGIDLYQSSKDDYVWFLLTQRDTDVKKTTNTGMGLFVDEDILGDSYVMEYCGDHLLPLCVSKIRNELY